MHAIDIELALIMIYTLNSLLSVSLTRIMDHTALYVTSVRHVKILLHYNTEHIIQSINPIRYISPARRRNILDGTDIELTKEFSLFKSSATKCHGSLQ